VQAERRGGRHRGGHTFALLSHLTAAHKKSGEFMRDKAVTRLRKVPALVSDPGLTDARGGPQMLGWGDLHVAVYLVRIRVTSLCIQAPSRRTLMAQGRDNGRDPITSRTNLDLWLYL
jgi:hypothetical protein